MAFSLEPIDLQNIAKAQLKPNNNLWKDPDLEYLREKIKQYFISLPMTTCSYCYRSLQGEFRMVIDIEHILPKNKYKPLTYEPHNLNVSCKRCNMQYKKEKLDFIKDLVLMGTDYFNSNHYKFIHPNLDTYNDHLKLNIFQFGDSKYIKYIPQRNSKKGPYTYSYFELKNLEINCIDNAQGLQGNINLSDKIKGKLRLGLIKLLTKI